MEKKSAIPSVPSCSFEFQSQAYRFRMIMCDSDRANIRTFHFVLILAQCHCQKAMCSSLCQPAPLVKRVFFSFFNISSGRGPSLSAIQCLFKIYFERQYGNDMARRKFFTLGLVPQCSLDQAPTSYFAFSHLGLGGGRSCLMKCKPRMQSLTTWSCAQSEGNMRIGPLDISRDFPT